MKEAGQLTRALKDKQYQFVVVSPLRASLLRRVRSAEDYWQHSLRSASS
jgi:hypothetical protein